MSMRDHLTGLVGAVRRLSVVASSLSVSAMLVLAGCAATGTPGQESSPAPTGGVALLDVEQFASLLDDPDVTVVNVHVPYEGELPGTEAFVPYSDVVGADAIPVDREVTLAVYCRSGSMSREASAALVAAGYTDVRDLDGGMNAWQDAGRSLVFKDH